MRLDGANINRFRQRGERIACRRIFMREDAGKSEVRDRLRHHVVIQFLRLIDFVPSGISTRMKVR